MTIISVIYDVGVPVGTTIVLLIMIWMLYSLVKSSRLASKSKNRAISSLQLSAVVCIALYMVYDISLFFGRVVFDVSECSVRVPLVSVTWCFCRGALYFFFVIRCQVSFEGSSFAFSKWFIRGLEITIIILYSIFSIFYLFCAPDIVFDPVDRVCIPDPEKQGFILSFSYFIVLVDFILGVTCVALYAGKLCKLQNQITDVGDGDQNLHINFIKVAKRQCKLAAVAYVSTIVMMYIMPITGFFSAPYIDIIINVLCVWCSFGFQTNAKWFKYCCECGGIPWLQCLCCPCCFCCNISETDASKLAAAVKSNDNETTVTTTVTTTAATTTTGTTATTTTTGTATTATTTTTKTA